MEGFLRRDGVISKTGSMKRRDCNMSVKCKKCGAINFEGLRNLDGSVACPDCLGWYDDDKSKGGTVERFDLCLKGDEACQESTTTE